MPQWNARLLRHTQLSERVNRARLAVDQARLALEAEERRLSDRQAELGRRVAAGQEQAKALAAAQTILAHMAEQQARRDAIAAELREIGERAAALRSENDRIKADGQALNEKVEMLQAADTAACPLCRQPLTSEHRDRMLADLAEEHDALADRYRANGGEGKALSERKAALDAEDALLAHDLRARDARQRQAAQAEAIVAEGQVAADDAALVAGQRADVAARLAAGTTRPPNAPSWRKPRPSWPRSVTLRLHMRRFGPGCRSWRRSMRVTAANCSPRSMASPTRARAWKGWLPNWPAARPSWPTIRPKLRGSRPRSPICPGWRQP